MTPPSKPAAGVAAAALLLSLSPAGAEERQVVLATGGGSYEAVIREHWLAPFTEATGIRVVTVAAGNTSDARAKVQAMVATGNVTWDVFVEGELDAESPEHAARTEDIGAFCAPFAGRSDLAAGACRPGGVLFGRGATLMTFNRRRLGDDTPRTWADFWDVQRYPGPRAMPAQPDAWRQLVAALLADGVPRSDLFPLDVDRAFRKLDELKPHVGLWWRTGDQTTQGFRSGEYDLGYMWLTRATALRTEGQPIGWSYDGALLVGDRYAVVEGAPHRDEALALLEFYLDSPEVQARICEALTCTPPSADALAFMSEAARARMPSAEAIRSRMVVPDAAWINANKPMLIDRWNAWIQQ